MVVDAMRALREKGERREGKLLTVCMVGRL